MENKTLSRRGFLRLSAVSLAGVALAACGATPTATPAPKPTSAPAAAAPTAVPAAPAKKVSLRFLTWYGGDALDWFNKTLIPGFIKENPTVEKVDAVQTDSAKINELLLAGFAAGDPYDVFDHGSAASGASWAASGQTLALDDFFATLPTKADYYDVAIKTSMYQGKLYSLPRIVTPHALLYRKDWFKDAGLDPAKPPTTWDELRQYAKTLTKTSGDKITRAGFWVPSASWDGIQMGWFNFLHQNGISILTDDLSKTNFDNAAGFEAMNFYHDLLWKDKVDVLGGLPSTVAGNAVATGNAAMGIGSFGVVTFAKKNFPDNLANIAVAAPTSKVRPAVLLACDRTFLAAKGKSVDTAWKFLAYKSKPENMAALFAIDGGSLPPLKSFMQSDAAKNDPYLPLFLKNIDVGFQWPGTPKWNDIRSQFTTMSDGFMAQAGAVDEIVKNGAKEINAILAKQ